MIEEKLAAKSSAVIEMTRKRQIEAK